MSFKLKLKKISSIILISTIVIGLIGVAGFWSYVQIFSYKPQEMFLDKALNDKQVEIIQSRKYYTIKPKNIDPKNPKIIYYPGGLVEPEAYLFKLTQIAKNLKREIFLIRPIFNVAIFDINTANKILEERNLEKVIIGGHSLGGVSGCRFSKNNPEKIEMLFLFGSYCDQDISQKNFEVVSLMGKKDGIINQKNYENAKTNLPKNSKILENKNLNHSDFGNYGLQKEDNPSSLSDEEVIEILENAL